MRIFSEMFMCGDIAVTTLCTKLTCCHASSINQIAPDPFYMATVKVNWGNSVTGVIPLHGILYG